MADSGLITALAKSSSDNNLVISNSGDTQQFSTDEINGISGGELLALNVIAGMYQRIEAVGMSDCVAMCQAALDVADGAIKPLPTTAAATSAVDKKDAHAGQTNKRAEKRGGQDIFGRSMTFSPNQMKNQAIRFGLGGETLPVTPRPSRGGFFGGRGFDKEAESKDYEDVVSLSVLQAPICDICVVQKGEAAPKDFYRLHKTPNNKKADLNTSSGGNSIYLCIKKDVTGQLPPVTNLVVVFPDRNEYVPPGYVVVPRGKVACNLNSGTHSERIYLCYKKELHGNPVVDLQVVLPTKGESAPKNFTLIEKSVTGTPANLNSGSSSAPEIFLCYKQTMTRLKCLLAEPGSLEVEETVLVSRLRQRRQTISLSTHQSSDDNDIRMRSSSVSGAAFSPFGRAGIASTATTAAAIGDMGTTESPGKHRRSVTLNLSPMKTILSESTLAGSSRLSAGPGNSGAIASAGDSMEQRRLHTDGRFASRSDDNLLRGSEKLRQVALHELRRTSMTTDGSNSNSNSAEPTPMRSGIDVLAGASGIISVDSHDSESIHSHRSLSPRVQKNVTGSHSPHFFSDSAGTTTTAATTSAAAVASTVASVAAVGRGHKREPSMMSNATSGSDLLAYIKETDDEDTAEAASNQELAAATVATVAAAPAVPGRTPAAAGLQLRQRCESGEGSVSDSLSSRNSSPRTSNFKSIGSHQPVQIGLTALGAQRFIQPTAAAADAPPPEPPILSPFSPSLVKTVEGIASSAPNTVAGAISGATSGGAGIAAVDSSSASEFGADSSDGGATAAAADVIAVKERKLSAASVCTGASDDVRAQQQRLHEFGELYGDGGEYMLQYDYEEELALLQQLAHLSNQRRHNEVVDAHGCTPPVAARKALLSILSALYIRQGNVANLALAGLCDLLRDSDFFASDLNCLPAAGTLTMLDLTVEAVCDRFEVSADGERDPLLRFIGLLSQYVGRTLSLLSLQRIFRGCIFLCNHYASGLPLYSDPTAAAAVFEEDETQFGDDYNEFIDGNVDSNAITPFHALQKLIVDTLTPVEEMEIAHRLPSQADIETERVTSAGSTATAASATTGTYFTLDGRVVGSLENAADVLAPSAGRSSSGSISSSKRSSILSVGPDTACTAATAVGGGSAGSSPLGLDLSAPLSESELTVQQLLDDLIEDITDSIEVSRLSEAAYIAISKQSSSIVATPFWREIQLLGSRLFAAHAHAHRSAFLVLCGICKQCWHGVRTRKDNNQPIPRDLAGKLVALDALQFFLLSAGENMRLSKVMGYQIRRLVVPCIFYNVSVAFIDHRIFSRMMRIVSSLWKRWRRHLRIEFAILCEQFIFKIMQATVVQVRPMYKRIVIHEVIHWFDQPHMLLEMFVNYDMDRKFVSTWNIFSYFVRVLCSIARRLVYSNAPAKEEQAAGGSNGSGGNGSSSTGILIGSSGIASSSSGGQRNSIVLHARAATPALVDESAASIADSIRDVHLQALEEVGRMAKTLMDASGHALMIMLDSNFRNKTLAMGWAEDDDDGSGDRVDRCTSPDAARLQQGAEAASSNNSSASGEAGVSNGQQEQQQQHRQQRVGSVRLRRAAHQESEALIQEAVDIYKKNENDLKKAVKHLVENNFMANTPHEIANFLRVYKHSFDELAIGDFLGEGGKSNEEEHWAQIRFRYTRAVSFVELDVEQALRLYLTGCGFKLPGEGQKVDRIVESFAKAFWQDNSGTDCCPFRNQDEVHITAYAIIMLNTDLHKVNVGPKKKNRISKEAFGNMLRDFQLGSEYVSTLYDNVEERPIELEGGSRTPAASSGAASTAAAGASPSATAAAAAELDSKYFSSRGVSAETRLLEERNFQRELLRSLRDSEDTLRSLSARAYRFNFTNVDTKITLDLVSFMFESVWLHFHNVAEVLLFSRSSDVPIMNAALEILLHSLTSAIFLDLTVEKLTLAKLLQRVRDTYEKAHSTANNSSNGIGSSAQQKQQQQQQQQQQQRVVPDDSWYADVENANPYTALEITGKLHVLMIYLKDIIQETLSFELTRHVAAKFERRVKVLEKNTFFVHHGDLVKISRGGKPTNYRFFLFSDQLIYAHLSRHEYKVHEQLPLLTLTLSDIDDDPSESSFYIASSVKSFVVVAPSPRNKQQWLQLISQTIASCKKRQAAASEGVLKRRMSMFSRLEHQQNQQLEEMQESMRSPDRSDMRMSPQKTARNIAALAAAVAEAPPAAAEEKATAASIATATSNVAADVNSSNNNNSISGSSMTSAVNDVTDAASSEKSAAAALAASEPSSFSREASSSGKDSNFGTPSSAFKLAASVSSNKLQHQRSNKFSSGLSSGGIGGSNSDDDDVPVVKRVSYRDLHEAARLQKQRSSGGALSKFRPRGSPQQQSRTAAFDTDNRSDNATTATAAAVAAGIADRESSSIGRSNSLRRTGSMIPFANSSPRSSMTATAAAAVSGAAAATAGFFASSNAPTAASNASSPEAAYGAAASTQLQQQQQQQREEEEAAVVNINSSNSSSTAAIQLAMDYAVTAGEVDFLASRSSDSAMLCSSSGKYNSGGGGLFLSPEAMASPVPTARAVGTVATIGAAATGRLNQRPLPVTPPRRTAAVDASTVTTTTSTAAVAAAVAATSDADSDEDTADFGEAEDIETFFSNDGTETATAAAVAARAPQQSPPRKNRRQSDAARAFAELVIDLPPPQLQQLFDAGAGFYMDLQRSSRAYPGSATASLKGMDTATHARLYGLQRHVKLGSYDNTSNSSSNSSSSGSSSSSASESNGNSGSSKGGSASGSSDHQQLSQQQLDAWRDCADVDADQARREFLCTLYTAVPYWDYHQHILSNNNSYSNTSSGDSNSGESGSGLIS